MQDQNKMNQQTQESNTHNASELNVARLVRGLKILMDNIQPDCPLDLVLHNGCDEFFNEHFYKHKNKSTDLKSYILNGVPVRATTIIPKNEIWLMDRRGYLIRKFSIKND